LFNFFIQHFICYKLSFDFFFHSTFYEIIMICCQIRSFNIWFFLNCFFFILSSNIWLIGNWSSSFFFHFYFHGVISILYPWSHGLQVNSVWLVSIFFIF
jgi:hypothetical protein